jgi:hypothetical protein
MNCFNHADVAAVGLCKFCQKALCKECVHDLSYGLACREHIPQVTTANKVFESQALSPTQPSVGQIAFSTALIVVFMNQIAQGIAKDLLGSIGLVVLSLLFYGVLHVAGQHIQKSK